MPRQRFVVELDGQRVEIEGDRPPTEADVRAILASQPDMTATGPSEDTITGMRTDPASFVDRRLRGAESSRAVTEGTLSALAGAPIFGRAAQGSMGLLRTVANTRAGQAVGAGLAGAAQRVPVVGPMLRGAIRAGRASLEATAPGATPAARSASGLPLILSPAQATAEQSLMGIAKTRASQLGLLNAAQMREELLRALRTNR